MHYIPNYKIQLIREGKYNTDRKIIRSPEDGFEIMKEIFDSCVAENFYIIMLSTKNHILGISKISEGTLNASLVHPREIFQVVFMHGMVASIILCHNHPSSDPTPSPEDISITRKLVAVGKIMEIPVLDHLVIGDNRYVSLKEKGLID